MTVQAMNTRQFIEIAADTYVRGPDHRAYLNKRADVTAPIDDYLDQLWGPSFTPQQAELYKSVIQQLLDNILSGALKTYAWPMLVVDPRPSMETIENNGSVILLADFRKWVKKNSPAARPDWVDLIMEATEPEGIPTQSPVAGSPKVQMRGKATRKPKLPTRAQLNEWGEKFPYAENVGRNAACIAFSRWLKEAEYMDVSSRTLNGWFDWNNSTWKLEPNEKALQRGFESNGIEAS